MRTHEKKGNKCLIHGNLLLGKFCIDRIHNIDFTNLTKTEIVELLNYEQKNIIDLLKENLELTYSLKKTRIIKDNISATFGSKEKIIESWENNQKELNRVLKENHELPYFIRANKRRIEHLQEQKVIVKNEKKMWLDYLKD